MIHETEIAGASILLFAMAAILGFRHGIDWDHIAAIADISSTTSENPRKSFFLNLLYIIGHINVVLVIGVFAVSAGILLPESVDQVMGTVVGITLVLLGFWVIYSLNKHYGDDFRMRARWVLFINSIIYLYDWLIAKLTKTTKKDRRILKDGYGNTSAYAIGIIHGIGAETASQVMLFVTAAGVGSVIAGVGLLLTFTIGLVSANTVIALLLVSGYAKSDNKPKLYRMVAWITAIFSLIIGFAFLFGLDSKLPDLTALLGG